MKIVFDCEKQKKDFLEAIVIDYCPISIDERFEKMHKCDRSKEKPDEACVRCFEGAIEMEVLKDGYTGASVQRGQKTSARSGKKK